MADDARFLQRVPLALARQLRIPSKMHLPASVGLLPAGAASECLRSLQPHFPAGAAGALQLLGAAFLQLQRMLPPRPLSGTFPSRYDSAPR